MSERSTVLSSFCDDFSSFSSVILTCRGKGSFPGFHMCSHVRGGDPLDIAAFLPPNLEEVQYFCKWLTNFLHSGLIS